MGWGRRRREGRKEGENERERGREEERKRGRGERRREGREERGKGGERGGQIDMMYRSQFLSLLHSQRQFI